MACPYTRYDIINMKWFCSLTRCTECPEASIDDFRFECCATYISNNDSIDDDDCDKNAGYYVKGMRRMKKDLTAIIINDFKDTCDNCCNTPFDSRACITYTKECKIHPLRKKWEEKNNE